MRQKDKEVEEHRIKCEKDYEEFRRRILSMSAGKEIDMLVAEKVVGLIGGKAEHGKWYDLHKIPDYSTNISDAWRVVDVFPTVTVGKDPPMYGVEQPDCSCYIGSDYNGNEVEIWAETVPLAICRAALLVVMEE